MCLTSCDNHCASHDHGQSTDCTRNITIWTGKKIRPWAKVIGQDRQHQGHYQKRSSEFEVTNVKVNVLDADMSGVAM